MGRCVFAQWELISKRRRHDLVKGSAFCLRGSLSLPLRSISKPSGTPLVHFSFLGGGSGRLYKTGYLLTFPTYRVGAYSRWALNRIKTVNYEVNLPFFSVPLTFLFVIHYYLHVFIDTASNSLVTSRP